MIAPKSFYIYLPGDTARQYPGDVPIPPYNLSLPIPTIWVSANDLYRPSAGRLFPHISDLNCKADVLKSRLVISADTPLIEWRSFFVEQLHMNGRQIANAKRLYKNSARTLLDLSYVTLEPIAAVNVLAAQAWNASRRQFVTVRDYRKQRSNDEVWSRFFTFETRSTAPRIWVPQLALGTRYSDLPEQLSFFTIEGGTND